MRDLIFKLAIKLSKVGWFRHIYNNGVMDGAYTIALLVKGATPETYDGLVDFVDELITNPSIMEHRSLALRAFKEAKNNEED